MGDINALTAIVIPLPARPDEVQLTVVLKHRSVDGPSVAGIGDLSHHTPAAGGGFAIAFQKNLFRVFLFRVFKTKFINLKQGE